MNYKKEELEKLEESINMLHDKATHINNKIKSYNNKSNIDKEFIFKKSNLKKTSVNLENKPITIEKLEIEILNLKKKQDTLTFILYIISLIFIFSLLAIYELKYF